jgi:hypothetical protein
VSRGASKAPGEFGGDAMVDIVEFGWKPEGEKKLPSNKNVQKQSFPGIEPATFTV